MPIEPQIPAPSTWSYWLAVAVTSAVVAACGGGGASGGGYSPPPPPPPSGFPPSASLINQCAVPRTGNDPTTGAPYPDQPGTLAIEKQWLRSWMDEAYLFYNNVPTVSAGSYGTLPSYFNALLDRTHDRFSFTLTTAEANSFFSGDASIGYGIDVVRTATGFKVDIVLPGSPAASAGVARGMLITAINGTALSSAGFSSAQVNAFFYPSAGAAMTLTVIPSGSSAASTLTMNATSVTPKPVFLTTTLTAPDGGKVGYIVFTDHIESAQNALADAFKQVIAAGARDAVLDLRYNGGGYIFIASQAAYMLGGSNVSSVPVFETLQYNNKRSSENYTYRFLDQLYSISSASPNPRAGEKLSSMNLRRVYLLTQAGTCSASESIINGLKGANIEVVQIGGTTCGKPYGFQQKDNCGLSYFAIEFDGINNKGEGGYINGFTPTCAVADDLDHALGNPNEGMLAAALYYRTNGRCPSAGLAKASSPDGLATAAWSERYRPSPLSNMRWIEHRR